MQPQPCCFYLDYMAACPHHLSPALTMEPLRRLNTQSPQFPHTRHTHKEIDCRLHSLPLKSLLPLSNIHPPRVCRFIQRSSADTARCGDFLFLASSLPTSTIQPCVCAGTDCTPEFIETLSRGWGSREETKWSRRSSFLALPAPTCKVSLMSKVLRRGMRVKRSGQR